MRWIRAASSSTGIADPVRHRDNAGLRLAMRRAVPLIYLFGVVRGEYMPVWPVFIVRDDPESLAFSVAVDLKETAVMETAHLVSNLSDARRATSRE